MHQWSCFSPLWVSFPSRIMHYFLMMISFHRISPSPSLLFSHFFAVAFYSIWVLFTHPRRIPSMPSDAKPTFAVARITEYPQLLVLSIRVVCYSLPLPVCHTFINIFVQFWAACVVFCPLLWSEIRWW